MLVPGFTTLRKIIENPSYKRLTSFTNHRYNKYLYKFLYVCLQHPFQLKINLFFNVAIAPYGLLNFFEDFGSIQCDGFGAYITLASSNFKLVRAKIRILLEKLMKIKNRVTRYNPQEDEALLPYI